MFTAKPQKNRGAATTYFDEHLSHNDYYSQAETQAGHWIGVGAERLGLKQGEVVSRDTFLRLCDNLHPETGEPLTQTTFKHRRIFFDFQCAPPKSVSILAVTMDDQRIVEAHREASQIAIRELEQFASTRIRKGGIEDQDRVTGNLVGAAFQHSSSRALDPQLHTHFVLFNCTWDQTEQRWKALQTSAMFDAIHYGTAVYRNELVSRLHRIGHQIRHTGNAFEIEGVDPKFIERFSKRSRQRDLSVKQQEQKLGRKLTKDEVAHVVHQTRPKKLKGATDEKVREQQLGELGWLERRALRKVGQAADGLAKDWGDRVTTDQAVHHAIAHVFERASVVSQYKILEAALVKGRGQLDLERLKKGVTEHPELVSVGSEFSTRDILTKELFLIRTVNDWMDSVRPLVHSYEPSPHLGPDQRDALAHVLTSRDCFTGFRGLAGSGKSTTLVELARVLRRERLEPVFCAPTTSAVNTLNQDLAAVPGGLNAVTVTKLLTDPSEHRLLSTRSVIILDEAGAVGVDDMAKLFDLALSARCRVILSGDTGQHSSVSRGDALRILEQHSQYRFAELNTIRRQKPQAFREIVQLAADKQPDKAFAKLLELGAVTEVLDDGQLYQNAADAYLSAVKQGRSALLVSPTWSEIEAVTDTVRQALKADGAVSRQETAVTVFDSLSWTAAQKKNLQQYEPGQQIRFIRSTKGFAQNETAEVVRVEGQSLKLRRAGGGEGSFSPVRAASSIDVGKARELKVAAGDWLLLQANHGKEFFNGERVQVKRLSGEAIELTDGRAIPASYRTFTHGYAVTSHSSQGKTVDEVLLVASSKSFAAVSREQFYVSISRGRERVHVFTDDADQLARHVTKGGQRKAAVELQALRDDLARLGFVRSDRLEVLAPGKPPPTVATRAQNPNNPRGRRLVPVEWLRWIAYHLRHWLGHKLGVQGMVAAVPDQVSHTVAAETVKLVESIRSAQTFRLSLKQRLAVRRSTNRRRRGHSRGA